MANSKRSATEAFIIKYIEKLMPKTTNKAMYERLFSEMNDKQFDQFMQDLESGERFLVVISPNFSDNDLKVENNLKVGDELGHNFFQKVWIEGKGNIPTYLTPNEYMVVDLPIKRASQLLIKKISVPDHNRVVDAMTGQPTGESKGARISYPELQICASMGLEESMLELMKYRGGDNKGLVAYNGMISKYGTVDLNSIKQYSSGVESTKSLKTFMNCCHIKSTI